MGYFDVPRGDEMILPALEADRALAQRFFGCLRMLFYAGAGMPESTCLRLEAVAASVRDEPPRRTRALLQEPTGRSALSLKKP